MWYLETASSSTEQRRYEKALREAEAPGCVPVEMIEQWPDWVRTSDRAYETVDMTMYSEPVFSADEQSAILRFHQIWNETADETPNPMPWTIEELLGTPVWDRFQRAADEALTIFMRRGHLLEKAKFGFETQG